MPARYETELVNVALSVVRAVGSPEPAIGGEAALRLALRVLLDHVPDPAPLTEVWDVVHHPKIPSWPGCERPFDDIVRQLQHAGFAIVVEHVRRAATD